ncbi:MAG TPA: hypothetical protein VF345_07255 [Chthoniobacterales bacterium]
MNSRFLAALACVCILSCRASAGLPLGGAKVHFASQSEGRQILTAKDDFIQRLGPFDRSARMKTDKAISETEFLEFVRRNVVDWTTEERQTVQAVIEAIQPLLRGLPLSLPPTIQVIKTTGAEQGDAAYTQGTAIVLPKAYLGKSQQDLQKLICHELFHILSRHNPELRERLYEIIGFTKCKEIELPPELKRRKITNPDAPRNDHFIRVQIDGRESFAVPILLSSVEKYDVKRGGEFFDYLQFQFLVVEKSSGSQDFKPVSEGSSPKLVKMQYVSGFMEQVGRNTDYVVHPEEILADNFALLVLNEHNVVSPDILQKMREVLMRKTNR